MFMQTERFNPPPRSYWPYYTFHLFPSLWYLVQTFERVFLENGLHFFSLTYDHSILDICVYTYLLEQTHFHTSSIFAHQIISEPSSIPLLKILQF